MKSLTSKGRFSIKTLLIKQNEFSRPKVCEYFSKISQLIRDRTGCGDDYTDSYMYCGYLKTRITKKHCKNCNFYKPINN